MLLATYFFYITYIIFVFYYFSCIFGVPMVGKVKLSIFIGINSFLVFVPIYITEFRVEWLMMLIYFVVIWSQIALAYKQSLVQTISAVLCFTINYFGIRVLLIGIFAYNSGQQVIEVLGDIDNRIKITAITFLILAPYILVSSKILISRVIKFLFSDIPSLKLAAVLLGISCISQILALPTLYIETEDPLLNSSFQIMISLLALISFILIMVIVFIYSKLKQASVTYEVTSEKIKRENTTVARLEAEAKTDFFTGFYVRSVVVKKLQKFVAEHEKCYIVYLDLDGLKIVNDSYGHEEGDWYIQEVSKEIQSVFSADTVARIGGDEFLVVGNDSALINDKVQRCYAAVLKLKEKNKKEYETSMSYGLTEVESTNIFTAEELIELTDDKMYTFKKARNKERKQKTVQK